MTEIRPIILVGLGNPGEEYAHSRHNAGRIVLERIASTARAPLNERGKYNAHTSELSIGGAPCTILLPNTYMNKSGSSVSTVIGSKEDASVRLVVVYDDLDLPWGTVRIAYGRGSGGHNGVESVIKSVGTRDFVRIRIGVAPVDPEGVMRKPRGADAVLSFIMGNFTKREQEEMAAVADRVRDALVLIITKGRLVAMNTVNTR